MKKLLLLVSLWALWLLGSAQDQSPLTINGFAIVQSETVNLEEVPRDARKDWNNNPICLIKFNAVDFDANLMQKFTFIADGLDIMYKTIQAGSVYLYVSSNLDGTISIKYLGDCVFTLPYKLEPLKVYELKLGMKKASLVIKTTPAEADIYIDGEKVGNGYAGKKLSIDEEHKYMVQCDDYYPEEGTVVFKKAEKKEIEVTLSPDYGYLIVNSTPAAEIYDNGKMIGATPYNGRIKQGQHRIEIKKEGYKTFVKVLDINVGDMNDELRNVALETKKMTYGTLELNSTPKGALITIDGKEFGRTPATLDRVETGILNVVFSVEGYNDVTQTVELAEGKKEIVFVTMERKVNNVVEMASVQTSGKKLTSYENKTINVNGVKFEMIAVEGGTFTMGATPEQGADAKKDENPAHSVTVDDYYIGKTEVTKQLWIAVMGVPPNEIKGIKTGNKIPVYRVKWKDCQDFISKLNELTGLTFRLPTEAEWEYAARGGKKSQGFKYSGSNKKEEVDLRKEGFSDIYNVGMSKPNELGIYDMSGNVKEWCSDWYAEYSSESQTNPAGPEYGSEKVYRQGRVSERGRLNSDYYQVHYTGFRLVLVP